MDPTLPWYKSAIIRQQIVQLIIAGLALVGVTTDVDWSTTVEALFGGVAAGVAVWTVVTRLFKPAPNLTQTAKEEEKRLVALGKIPKQGGVANPLMLALLLAFTVPVVAYVSGCTGTRAAYKEAQSPDEYAFVLAEHYASLVREAADLKARPTTRAELVSAMQAADTAAGPVIDALRPLRDAYLATQSAASEAELQDAVNRAVLAIADLVRSVKAARGSVATSRIEQRILFDAERLERSPA